MQVNKLSKGDTQLMAVSDHMKVEKVTSWQFSFYVFILWI